MEEPKRNFKRSYAAGFSGLAIAVGLFYYWFVWSSHFISTEDAYVETELSPVNSRIMGYVREVYVDESDEVKEGQQLLKLDDSDVKLELGYKQAKFKKAEEDGSRADRLVRENAVSASDHELAEAQLTGARADLEGSMLKLRFTDVRAPVDGVVAKRSSQPGQFVQPGQSLFVIVPKGKLWIRANFKENQLSKIHPNQKVKIFVDAYPGESWTGRVDRVLPTSVAALSLLPPENATGNFTKVVQRFPVRIAVDAKAGLQLRPGMSVNPTITVE